MLFISTEHFHDFEVNSQKSVAVNHLNSFLFLFVFNCINSISVKVVYRIDSMVPTHCVRKRYIENVFFFLITTSSPEFMCLVKHMLLDLSVNSRRVTF